MKLQQQKLKEFISTDKFSDEIWADRGLNSSGDEMSNRLNTFFNQCANKLLEYKEQNYKECLNNQLKQIDSMNYDTEEREFIVDYFFDLAEICSIDLKEELMKWMYGEDMTKLMKPQKSSTEELVCTSCSVCGGAFYTVITEREKGIPDYPYLIVKCKVCSELNLIDLGSEVKQFSFAHSNYKLETKLPKSEYSKEPAIEKMKKMKSEKYN